MKKTYFLFTFFWVSLYISPAYSQVEEIVVTGERTTPGHYSHYGNLGVPSTPNGSDPYYSLRLYYARTAEISAKEQKEKIAQCKTSTSGTYYLCRINAHDMGTKETLGCSKFIFNDNLLNQCNLAVAYETNRALDVCELNQTMALARCDKI